jgi:uncharacterized membrane protein
MLVFGVPLHKLLIHFPVALIVVAVLYDSWALYAKKPELHRTSYGLTMWAAVGALAAVGTGLQLADLIRIDKGAVTGHAGFAIASTIVVAAVGGLRYSAQVREQAGYPIGWLIIEIGAAVLIIATALTGHLL